MTTLSRSATMLLAPPTHSTYCGSDSDLYAEAVTQLREKVPQVLSNKELNSFLEVTLSGDCTTHTHALHLLRSTEADVQYCGKFHQFFSCLKKLLEPLRLFTKALDTLCQVHSTFCLVWGSVKGLIEVAKEVTAIPTAINEGITTLIKYLPVYDKYHEYLTSRSKDGLLLQRPLVAIYVEYLTFCILVRRVAKSRTAVTIKYAFQEENPFKTCLKNIETEVFLIHHSISLFTRCDVNGLSDKFDILINYMKSRAMTPRSSFSSATLSGQCHMVPGIFSSIFTGRENEVQWLQKSLAPESEDAREGRAGIYGITGVGKTQLMLKYEAKYREFYDTQIFLNASSASKFHSSVQEALEVLDLPQCRKEGTNVKIQGLHDWLLRSRKWLLLIDNVEDKSVALIQRLLASDAPGHVIITSQLESVVDTLIGSPKQCLELREFGLNDAIDMFLVAANVEVHQNTHEVVSQLVRAMGFMPHAIEQAASYIKMFNLSLGEFLIRYKQAPEEILDWNETVYTSDESNDNTRRFAISRHFRLIFDSLKASHPDALILLKFYSLLEPETIPLFEGWHRADWAPGFNDMNNTRLLRQRTPRSLVGLFSSCFGRSTRASISDEKPNVQDRSDIANSSQQTVLFNIFQDRSRLEHAIARLCDLSLVRRVQGRRVLWMHDLTKRFARSRISSDLDHWIEAAINVLYHSLPIKDETAEEQAWVETCLPQATTLIDQAKARKFKPKQYVCLLVICAVYHLSHGSWGLSKKQLDIALPIYKKYLGPENQRTIVVLNKLAWATRHGGDMVAAENYFQQALELWERVRGPNEPETLQTLNDLASTIERAGRLKEAEKIFKRLHQLHMDASGLEDIRTMAAAHNLALCLFNQGRLQESEKLYQDTLSVSEKHLGLEDLGTLKTMSNFAAALDHDGRLEEAQAAYDRALAPLINVLGFDHHLTLRLRVNMAGLLRQKGDFSRAELMMRECHQTVSKIFGKESFETISDLYELGEVWQAKGDFGSAKNAFEEAMNQLSDDMLNHPVVFRFIDSWGAVERELGHLDIAMEKSKESFDKFEALLGWDDPYTLMAANDHAEVLLAEGEYKQAWSIFARCRDSFGALLGKDHPHYAMVLNNLGRAGWNMDTGDPLQLFSEAQEILAKRVGAKHYCTLTVSLNIARTIFATGDREGGMSLVKDTKSKLETAVGSEHPLVLACDMILGIMHASRGGRLAFTESKGFLLTAVETAKKSDRVASANYFLTIGLLSLVLRRLSDDMSVIKPFLMAASTSTKDLSPFTFPNAGKLSMQELLEMDAHRFDFTKHIPLPTGESMRLRWGRRTCWRDVESIKVQG